MSYRCLLYVKATLTKNQQSLRHSHITHCIVRSPVDEEVILYILFLFS